MSDADYAFLPIYVEVIPDGPSVPETSSTAQSPLSPGELLEHRLKSAYSYRVELFNRELSDAYSIQGSPVGYPDQSRFPQVMVRLTDDEDDDPELVQIDHDLFTTLWDIYVLFGWKGIVEVEKRLMQDFSGYAPDLRGRPSGESRSVGWATLSFFLYTKNMLAMLVLDALRRLDQQAAEFVVGRCQYASLEISRAYLRFGIEQKVEYETYDAPGGQQRVVETKNYTFKNKTIADTLWKDVKEALSKKAAYEEALRTARDDEESVHRWQPSGIPYDEAMKREPYAQAKVRAAASREAARQALDALGASIKKIGRADRLALSSFEVLTARDGQSQWETTAGHLLHVMAKRIDELVLAIEHETQRMPALPDLPEADHALSEVVQRWVIPDDGFERYLINEASEELSGKPGFYSLLSEAAWETLCAEDETESFDFDHIVAVQYLTTLLEVSAEAEAEREQIRKSKEVLYMLDAAVSIAALLLSPVPGAGAALLAASQLLSLALIATSIHSYTELYQDLMHESPRAIEQLGDSDSPNPFEDLAHIGQLIHTSENLAEEITWDLVYLLTLQGLSRSGWTLVRRAIILDGYYNDLETIFPDEP